MVRMWFNAFVYVYTYIKHIYIHIYIYTLYIYRHVFARKNLLTNNSGVSKIRHVWVGRSPLGRWFIAMVTYAVVDGIHIYILYIYIHIYIYITHIYNVIYEIIYIWVINNIRFSSDALTQQMGFFSYGVR